MMMRARKLCSLVCVSTLILLSFFFAGYCCYCLLLFFGRFHHCSSCALYLFHDLFVSVCVCVCVNFRSINSLVCIAHRCRSLACLPFIIGRFVKQPIQYHALILFISFHYYFCGLCICIVIWLTIFFLLIKFFIIFFI